MNCSNCGAAMRLLRGRGHFVCDYCGALAFPPREDSGDDGVHDLGRFSEVSCPVCAHSTLGEAVLEGEPGLHCRECRGVLLTNDSFAQVVKRRRARCEDRCDSPQPIDPRELARRLTCPVCARVMDVHPYYGPGAVVVDTCADCTLIWLDHGELTVIERAPGRV